MRKLLYRALTESAVLLAEIPIDRWLSGGSVDITPALPFAVIKFGGGDVVPSPSGWGISRVEIWIHDEKGSYTRIDKILNLIKDHLDGNSFMWIDLPRDNIAVAEWTSTSGDLVDGGYNTNTRLASYKLVGRST